MSPATLLTALNKLGHDNGIGRLDLVENRFVGMKSRGMYETPGGTILLAAHRAIESITLDRGAAHLKDELMPKYAELIYNGFWFSPEREMLQVLIDKSQEMVAGRVRLKLYKGGVHVIGRDSPAFAVRPGPRDLRGRRRRLRPPRRRRLHQAQRAAPADAGEAEEEGCEGVTPQGRARFRFAFLAMLALSGAPSRADDSTAESQGRRSRARKDGHNRARLRGPLSLADSRQSRLSLPQRDERGY